MKSLEAICPRPLHNEVADRLRELIARGDLGPGERLNERLLTERFGISRTPLREAVKILSAEGLVKLLPNRGAVVVTITSADAEDMFQVMASLEALGGKLACERASDADLAQIAEMHQHMRASHAKGNIVEYFESKQRIHERMIECAGNRELAVTYRRIATRVRCPRFNSNFSPPQWDAALEEDDRIIEALLERDGQRLSELLTTEITNRSKVVQHWLAIRQAQVENAASASPRAVR